MFKDDRNSQVYQNCVYIAARYMKLERDEDISRFEDVIEMGFDDSSRTPIREPEYKYPIGPERMAELSKREVPAEQESAPVPYPDQAPAWKRALRRILPW
jgi:hypothetical protein